MIAHVHPNIPAIPPWEWRSWLHNLYGLEEVDSRNALWINLLLWDPCYYFLFMRPLVQRLFQIRNFMQYLLLVLPPGANKIDFLDNLGTRVVPKDCANPKSCQTLYLMQRQDFIITYKIRRAVEEDNDDLIPLINSHSIRLQETYGSYYIAELLTRHKDSGRQIIVAEHQGSAVAVLCLNETVNYQILNEEFELTPYNGLKKPHPDDTDVLLDILYPSMEQLQLQHKFEEEVTDIIEKKLSFETIRSRFSEQEFLIHVSITSSDDYSLVFTSASMFVFQDDEDKKSYSLDSIDREPNAFALEIAASHPDHEAGLKMLFESSFECFTDRDYCIMSVPSTVPTNNLTNYFGRVIPRSYGTFPYELYLLHRNSVLSKIDVEMATRNHEKPVKLLLSTIPNNYYIIQQFDTFLYNKESPFMAFVLTSENQVVGIAILSEEFEVDRLQAHYDLSSVMNPKMHRTGSHGLLEALVMSPIFMAHGKYFLRELHRLSDFSI
ncbi:hypothetical protein NQ314_003144, partial [Rhamnusium bicolor]